MNTLIAKKSLGQHFLRSEKALTQIVENIDENFDKKKWVFEIGPGEGVLTRKLLESGYRVMAIEIDPRSIEILEKDLREYIAENRLKILQKNCLEVDYAEILKSDLYLEKKESGASEKNKTYILIGNIPYYITGAIFRHTFEQNILPKQAIFLVQKEVAERIVARDKKESILSISIKIFGEAKYIDTVKAGSFAPPPKVDSAIISINNIQNIFSSEKNYDEFFKILKAAFKQKRGVAISNIKKILGQEYFEKMQKYFKEKERAEDVDTNRWINIAKEM